MSNPAETFRPLLMLWLCITFVSGLLFGLLLVVGVLPYAVVYLITIHEDFTLNWVSDQAVCAGVAGFILGASIRVCHRVFLPPEFRPLLKRLWLWLIVWVVVCAALAVEGARQQVEIYAALKLVNEEVSFTTPTPGISLLFTGVLSLFIVDTLLSGLILWHYRAAAKPSTWR